MTSVDGKAQRRERLARLCRAFAVFGRLPFRVTSLIEMQFRPRAELCIFRQREGRSANRLAKNRTAIVTMSGASQLSIARREFISALPRSNPRLGKRAVMLEHGACEGSERAAKNVDPLLKDRGERDDVYDAGETLRDGVVQRDSQRTGSLAAGRLDCEREHPRYLPSLSASVFQNVSAKSRPSAKIKTGSAVWRSSKDPAWCAGRGAGLGVQSLAFFSFSRRAFCRPRIRARFSFASRRNDSISDGVSRSEFAERLELAFGGASSPWP